MKPVQPRKANARLHTQVDLEAIAKVKEKREECEVIPECFRTEEELGCDDLLLLMPDTWNNIAWVIQNSVEVLVKNSLENRRLVEEVRDYAIKWNGDHLDTFLYMLEKGNQTEIKVM
jgi:hypothetical protein